jgi:Holliday junction resolvase RusA-like endonuclease
VEPKGILGEAMKLDIQAVPPSLNKTLNMNRWDRARLNLEWRMQIRAGYMPNGAAREKQRVTITLWHSREYDRDNLFGAVKPVVDALKHWKLIVDDTKEWLELDVQQAKCPHKQRHTTIEIEPVK